MRDLIHLKPGGLPILCKPFSAGYRKTKPHKDLI
jgi:hypothetical protein